VLERLGSGIRRRRGDQGALTSERLDTEA
jgi:hypothetical protein